MKNYYYVSAKEYIVSQLERNGIHNNDFDISDYDNLCKSAEFIAGLLDEKGLLCRKCSDAVNAHMADRKFPFVFLTLNDVKYYFLSFDAVVEAVSEYRTYNRVFQFITMISGKFTEEYFDRVSQQIIQKKKYFGRVHFHPEKFHVLGKLSWDGDKAYIQPIIIY
ncbi:MAG: hypothetical protein K2J40_07290 [Ruminococcus sp.]|nr:hypothetical protein [Ruminococcus sp.]